MRNMLSVLKKSVVVAFLLCSLSSNSVAGELDELQKNEAPSSNSTTTNSSSINASANNLTNSTETQIDTKTEAQATNKKRTPVKVSEKSILPLRILTRSMSSIYKEPDEKSAVVQGNLAAFMPYFVYTRPSGEEREAETGWYEIGADNRGNVIGWMKAADIFEWKQTMCLTYTHPNNRKPVLMFEDAKTITELLPKTPEERTKLVEQLYATINSGNIPQNFEVISVEPNMDIDFQKQFYLLPILEHKTINIDGREARLLELAAVSGGGAEARQKTDIRTNKEYTEQANISSAEAATKVAKDLQFDIVWVIDSTRSMGPYIDATRAVVENVSKELAKDTELAKNLRFGVWSYRDPVEAIPDIEYTTKNFTPELQDINSFLKTISTVKETTVDSIDFPEDVFSGVNNAINATKWNPEAIRVMILVGDAPGHELGHKFNVSGHDQTTIRSLATENKITMLTLQVRPQGAIKHQKLAEKQFKNLSLNPGADVPAYYSINGTELGSFTVATQEMVGALSAMLKSGKDNTLSTKLAENNEEGELAALKQTDTQLSAEATKAIQEGNKGLNQSLNAAVVQWIGSKSSAQAPRDILAWVIDKDLTESSKQALEVRLLINKSQLDSLATLLSEIITAGRKGQITGEDFFTSLQAASAVASRDPNMLKNVQSLAQSGLVPDFLSGLPYHSRLMDMSNELWNSWSPDEQDTFINELEARVKAYKALHDNPEGWIKLSEGQDADETVFPIPLELLP